MAGKKKSRAKLYGKEISGNQLTTGESVEQHMWSGLMADVLVKIIFLLSLKENIRVSAVCKTWHSVSVSLRVIKRSPWILRLPKSHDDFFEFYDHEKGKTYFVEFPEIQGFTACYSKDNWILLCSPVTEQILFFNPFNRQLVRLPNFKLLLQTVAFSSAPTSPNCIVFAVVSSANASHEVAVSTCQPGATGWSTINYPSHLPFRTTLWNKIVFNQGRFYCLCLSGSLGVYDTQAHTWTVHFVYPPRSVENRCGENWMMGKFMLEHEGDIFVTYICHTQKPIVSKFDQNDNVWKEIRNLGGLTFFSGFLTSYVKPGLDGGMRNSVYLSKVQEHERCVYYSFDDDKYYPRKPCLECIRQDTYESIWVEPPQDFDDFS